MRFYVRRLSPGMDFRREIDAMILQEEIQSGCLVSAVGSLVATRLRLAGGEELLEVKGPMEIVSATGTVGMGTMHIHLAVADSTGRTLGGHLVDGCIINTTAEIEIAAVEGWSFPRLVDDATGYPELAPKPVE